MNEKYGCDKYWYTSIRVCTTDTQLVMNHVLCVVVVLVFIIGSAGA